VLAVFKGDKKDMKTVGVYHLRQADADNVPNGPVPAKFEVGSRKRYLMFLKREADGRYTIITGQTDSAIGVKELGTYP
jgi:hypothetical protein